MKKDKIFVDILEAYYDEYDGQWLGYKKEGQEFDIEKKRYVNNVIVVNEKFMTEYKKYHIKQLRDELSNYTATPDIYEFEYLYDSELFDNVGDLYIKDNKVFIGNNKEILKIEELLPINKDDEYSDIVYKITFRFCDK